MHADKGEPCRCFCTAAGWVGTNESLRVQMRGQHQMQHTCECRQQTVLLHKPNATQVPALEGASRGNGAALAGVQEGVAEGKLCVAEEDCAGKTTHHAT